MEKWKVQGTLVIVNLIYGANYAIAKAVMPHYISPFGFIFVRVFFATLLFWAFNALVSGHEKIDLKDFPRLALCGLLGVAANQLLFFSGLNLTSPINASLIMTTVPVIVLLASALILGERIGWKKVVGISLGLSGAILLVLNKKELSLENSSLTGDLMVLLNGTSYSLYLVLVKPLMQKYNSQTVVKWAFLVGLIIITPFGWQEAGEVNWGSLPTEAWLAILYVVLGTTFLAYLLNAWTLRYANPSVVGIFIYLQPLFASIVAVSMGQDSLSWEKAGYSLLIFAGVYLVTRPAGKKKKA